ncbi:MAG: type II toxin-antitoxin system HigB family toxin [Campylobacteraceae bacterium]|jgi:mRNA interferase HigB|nr:type II toxin-antitoxin system HigB family toxin [Campylobacteraceae bacterium]
MRIIAKRTLVEFYTKYPETKTALEIWHSNVKNALWNTSLDIKSEYASASFLKDNRVVFNIKGNSFRLVVHVDYKRAIVRVKFIGTH